jgi:hypothetical protein
MELINTLEAPGEFDALSTLRPGEPYFLLVGRDRLAPGLVQQWAEQNRARAFEDAEAGRITDDQLNTELRKSTQAEGIGWSMTGYKKGALSPDQKLEQPRKRPVDTYSGSKLPDDTIARDKLRTAQARAVAALNNAIAEVDPLIELLTGSPDGDPQDAIVILAEMKAAVDRLTPSRPGIE